MINANIPNQMSIEQAAKLMHDNLAAKDEESRNYIVNHFLSHLKNAGITPSQSFTAAFLLACAPFKDQS